MLLHSINSDLLKLTTSRSTGIWTTPGTKLQTCPSVTVAEKHYSDTTNWPCWRWLFS